MNNVPFVAHQTAEYVTAKMNEDHGGEASFFTFVAIAFGPIQSLDPVQDEPEWRVQFTGMSSSQWAEGGIEALPAGVLNDDANEYGEVCTIQVRQAPPSPFREFFSQYMLRVNGGGWIGLPRNPHELRDLKVSLREPVAVPAAEAPHSEPLAVPAPEEPYSGGGAAAAPPTAAGPVVAGAAINSSSSSDDDESDLLPPHTHAGGGLMF